MNQFITEILHAEEEQAEAENGGQSENDLTTELKKQTKATYTLRSIIRHIGKHPRRGHYVTDVRQKSGEWWTYNDSLARKADPDKIFSLERQRQGYIFFYEFNAS